MRINEPEELESRRHAAMCYYAVNPGRMESSNRTAQPAGDCEQARNPTSPQSSLEKMELCMSRAELELPEIEPQIVAVKPGPDTDALIGKRDSDPRRAAEQDTEKIGDSDALIDQQNTIDDKQEHKQAIDPDVGGSSSTNNRAKEGPILPVHERVDNSSDSDTDVPEETPRTGLWAEITHKAIKAFRDIYKSEVEREINKQAGTITILEKENKRLRRGVEQLRRQVSMLKEHSLQMEEKYRDATALLQKEKASATELKDDIARLSNAVPELTKDDQYFNTKFGSIFYSIESWVLRYFINSKMDSSTVPSLPTELTLGLSRLLGPEWETFAVRETLRTIEAVAVHIVQTMIFEPKILGTVGDMFPAVEHHFGSCPVDAVNSWRMRTTQIVISSPEFPFKVQMRVCETADLIESLLGPLADRALSPNGRMRRLKSIIQQAADLALECNKEPSIFTYASYKPGCPCQSNCMTDALRTVDDEHVGEDEACVRLLVSPAVLRTPENPNDEQIIIMKARVLRQTRPLPDSEECESTGNSNCDVITATQLDVAFGPT